MIKIDRIKEWRKNILRPLSNKRLFQYDFVGFDVETYGDKNKFYMGGLYYYEGKVEKRPVYTAFYDREEMIEFLLTHRFKGKYVVATNLDFDLTVLFYGTKYWNKLERLEQGGGLITATYKSHNYKKKGALKFIDTFKYAPFSVEKLGKIIGINKLEKPSCWRRIRDEQNNIIDYDVLKPKNQKQREELEEYNKYDCKISCDFMYFFQKGINEAGGKLQITMAGCSFDVWRRGFLKDLLVKEEYTLKKDIKPFIFEGYFGGRTEVYKRGYYENIYYYDINSLYPSVMREEYPKPNSVEQVTFPDTHYIKKYEGVSRVTVTTPKKLHKPFLPSRHKGKLCFPLGTLEGVYNHNELRYAIKLGYKVNRVHEQYIYTETFKPFKEFTEHFYAKRNEYKAQKSSMELPMKLLMNTLYGVFGMKKITVSKILETKGMTYKEYEKNIGLGAEDKNGILLLKQDKAYNGKRSFPILASYTTSKARILMYEYLKNPNVIYTDTDSIVTSKDLKIDSKELGEMKLEGKYKEGHFYKPKLYLLRNDEETIVKAKGLSKADAKDFDNILEGKSIGKIKLTKLRESIRRGFSPYTKIVLEKNFSLEDNKREWKGKNSSPLVIDMVAVRKEKEELEKTRLDYLREKKRRAEIKELKAYTDFFDSKGDDISY